MSIVSPRHRHNIVTLAIGQAESWIEVSGRTVSLKTQEPNGQGTSNWEGCNVVGCLGQLLPGHGVCIAHAAAPDRSAYIAGLDPARHVISFLGVEVSRALLDEVLRQIVRPQQVVPFHLNVVGADVLDPIEFEGMTFERGISFTGAIVRQSLAFKSCAMRSTFDCRYTGFAAGGLNVFATEFREPVSLSYVSCERSSISFTDCTFGRNVTADGIAAPLTFARGQFAFDVIVRNARTGHLSFNDCSIGGELDVAGSVADGFSAPRLRAPAMHELGPLKCVYTCDLAAAQFGTRVRLDIDAGRLVLNGTRFVQGGDILVRGGKVEMIRMSAGGRLSLAGSSVTPELPELLSIKDADMAGVSLAYLNLTRCLFSGAHSLDKLDLGTHTVFSQAPRVKFGVRRRAIADEFACRQFGPDGASNDNWVLPGTRGPSTVVDKRSRGESVELPALSSMQVAALYRSLRRGLELAGNQPGAADFYYGEMEMRRRTGDSGRIEQAIITLYWLSSGYGLRAWRAGAWLLMLVAAAGGVMRTNGLVSGAISWPKSILYVAQMIVPGLHPSYLTLTTTGEVTETMLAILGPLFIGLGLLAVRERVRR